MENLVTLFAVLAILGLFVIGIHNSILKNYNLVKRAWADVLVQERQRGRIIEELEKVLQKHTTYESSVQENITRLRQGIDKLDENIIDTRQQHKIDTINQELMKQIHVAVENYPELKASESFAKYMNEITNQENNVGAALRIFNANVADFNSQIQSIPTNIINNQLTKKQVIETFKDKKASKSFDYTPNID